MAGMTASVMVADPTPCGRGEGLQDGPPAGRLAAALQAHALRQPQGLALQDGCRSLSWQALQRRVLRLARQLQRLAPRAVALLADNGCDWAVADLALHVAGLPAVPLPLFFSAAQIDHALATAGVDLVLTDQAPRLPSAGPLDSALAPSALGALQALRLPAPTAVALPAGTTKITYTSGTTGEPKGVCLGHAQLETVAASLCAASQARRDDSHLCLLPLSTLLENVAGLHAPLLAGARVFLPRLAEVGLSGSSGLDAAQLLRALNAWRPSSVITVPQTLRAIVAAAEAGAALPLSLRHVAVGGAPVSATLLQSAAALGLPVYEGYGLSECASVVAVNRPGENKPGSVGRPLDHLVVDFAADGEILVRGLPWRGYLGEAAPAAAAARVFATGDIGHLDADGFLHLTGRKKHLFITAFGRNVAPEWVERELLAQPPVLQAAVFGEGRSFNTAVIHARAGTAATAIDAAVAAANRRLPDYARVGAWVAANQAFSPSNGSLTHNGRPRREHIAAAHAAQIDAVYANYTDHAVTL